MKILLVGGGSGGHVTPVIAVAKEIVGIHPRAKLIFWTDKKYFEKSKELIAQNGLKMPVKRLSSGKLRRYTNFRFMDYVRHFGMVLGNFFDGFRIVWGILQSFCRLVINRPDVIFLKGGYVCLPVGIVAGFLKIPYVIHDSDAAPGLTNRVLAKKAKVIATGMPLEFYKYPEGRAVWTGIPITESFRPVNKVGQRRAKQELGFDASKPLLVVTGGSLGALHINEAIAKILPELLKECSVVLIAGHESYDSMKYLAEKYTEGFKLIEFTSEIAKYFAAADVVVSRSGASTMSELASMKKAVVLVPNHKLPGFHQVKNAENYVAAGAAVLVRDQEQGVDEKELLKAVRKVLRDEALRVELSKKLGRFAKNDAAAELAKLVLAAARK